MSHYDTFRLIIWGILFVAFIVAGLLSSLGSMAEWLRTAGSGTRRARTAGAASGSPPVIIIRGNGVTVYASRESAEASMSWADVLRDPERMAFDAKGMEFVFRRSGTAGDPSPLPSRWNRMEPAAVELEPKSVMPHPGKLREALIRWLDGKGVEAGDGIALGDLILLASRTRSGRPPVQRDDADDGAFPLRQEPAAGARRIGDHGGPHPAAEPGPGNPTGMGTVVPSGSGSGGDEDVGIGAVVLIRDNGVTVYDSKEEAEASMTWADVVRNPSRRAFAVRGIELGFQRHQFCREDALKYPFWRKVVHAGPWADEHPPDVRLVALSPKPRPGQLRDMLVRWLEVRGVAVDGGSALGALIERAAGTRNWRRRP